MSNEKKLDNPVWHCLSETHRDFAIIHNNIKFYQPEYCPFGGIQEGSEHPGYIDEYSKLIGNFFIVGEKPVISKKLTLKKELICVQMTIEEKIEDDLTENIIPLNGAQSDQLFQLVNEIQPGYFMKKTYMLGDYFGIFKNGELIAVSGERMKMNAFTEVSAIVTHPSHRGKGYASQLIAHSVNNILNQNKIPFLHVAENNKGAIKLYESLGFTTRRKISFWNIIQESA